MQTRALVRVLWAALISATVAGVVCSPGASATTIGGGPNQSPGPDLPSAIFGIGIGDGKAGIKSSLPGTLTYNGSVPLSASGTTNGAAGGSVSAQIDSSGPYGSVSATIDYSILVSGPGGFDLVHPNLVALNVTASAVSHASGGSNPHVFAAAVLAIVPSIPVIGSMGTAFVAEANQVMQTNSFNLVNVPVMVPVNDPIHVLLGAIVGGIDPTLFASGDKSYVVGHGDSMLDPMFSITTPGYTLLVSQEITGAVRNAATIPEPASLYWLLPAGAALCMRRHKI